MKGTHIFALIVAVLWGAAIQMGLSGMDLARSQQIQGWPSIGQVHYYVHFPIFMLALVVAAWSLAARWPRFKTPASILLALAFLVLPVYFLAYTGGV